MSEQDRFDAMTPMEQGFYLMSEYGVKAANISLQADNFGLSRLDVAKAVANGANEGQALLGQAVFGSDKDTFDFGWQSSDQLTDMLDDLDGVQGNFDRFEDSWSAREQIVQAAFADGNDVQLVGTLNSDGTITQTVEFDFGA